MAEAGQQPHIPILVGGGRHGPQNFRWIAQHADGWLSTPGEQDIEDRVPRLREAWRQAGRDGEPQVVLLAGKPNADQLARWRDLGVDEVVFGLPDRSEAEVSAYVERLAAKVVHPEVTSSR